MINKNELKAEFARNDCTHKDVAEMLGISTRTLTERMRTGVFKSDEINLLIEKLNIKDPMRVFFNR